VNPFLRLLPCVALGGWLGLQPLPAAELVSVDTTGTQAGNLGVGENLYVSADGRYVAYESSSTNIVMPDVNGMRDVFVRDCTLRSNIWGSVAARSSSTSGSYPLGLTPDGRYVLFASTATNLVPGATSATLQLYRQDLWSNVTALVTVATNGSNASGSGVLGATIGLKVKRMSADGRFVVFLSQANDLNPNAGSGATIDAFCRDLVNGTTDLITATPDGQATDRNVINCLMSTNGRYFVFDSPATNVVPSLTNLTGRAQVYWRDRQTGTNTLVSVNRDGAITAENAALLSFSRDGRYVCFNTIATNIVPSQNDSNGTQDIFVRDMLLGETWLVSRATNGNTTASRVSAAEFSADSAWLLVSPVITDLVPGVTTFSGATRDLCLHHVTTRTNRLVTRSLYGPTGANDYITDSFAALSPGGRYTAFRTTATNLWAGGSNATTRLLLHDRIAEATFNPVGGNYVTPAYNEARFTLSDDEQFLFFLASENYDPNVADANKGADVFRARLRAAELKPTLTPGGPITGQGLALAAYILQSSGDLHTWSNAATNTANSNGVFLLTDPAPPGPQRYYRVVTP
jgi:hypothetical protein